MNTTMNKEEARIIIYLDQVDMGKRDYYHIAALINKGYVYCVRLVGVMEAKGFLLRRKSLISKRTYIIATKEGVKKARKVLSKRSK